MSWSQLNVHSYLEHSLKHTAANHATLELINAGSWFVDVETSNDDHFGSSSEVPLGDGDLADGLADSIDVVPLLGRNGDDGGVLAD